MSGTSSSGATDNGVIEASIQEQKLEAAKRAVQFIEPGMVVGLGSGSTAILAVRQLAMLLDGGILHDIVGIPTSTITEAEARRLNIPLTTLEDHPRIDLTIDGADEIDPAFNVIKGGGGALLREKIVAQASQREIIIVDETKPSPVLGTKWVLPVEVIPFGWGTQKQFLEELGATVKVRSVENDEAAHAEPFRTDHGNFILDANFGPIADPVALAQRLNARTGVVEHGLFLGLVTDVIIASNTGVELKQK